VAYLRQISAGGKVHCTIVFAKSKLAPLSKVTIPCLELLAAVEAVKIYQMLRRELDIPLATSTFWTDSMLVLQFINNESRRHKTFVANRIAYICSHTAPSQWRHNETDKNPGDDVSRGLTADQILSSRRWVSGPEFLWDEIQNPRVDVPELSENCEIRKTQVFSTDASIVSNASVDRLLEYYSCDCLRFKGLLLQKIKKPDSPVPRGSLTVEEIKQAEISIVRHVQKSAYSAEIKDLQNGKQYVHKSSSLYPLEPFLIDSGVLCVGGRLQNFHWYIIKIGCLNRLFWTKPLQT
jgi:hypothetical protein